MLLLKYTHATDGVYTDDSNVAHSTHNMILCKFRCYRM